MHNPESGGREGGREREISMILTKFFLKNGLTFPRMHHEKATPGRPFLYALIANTLQIPLAMAHERKYKRNSNYHF